LSRPAGGGIIDREAIPEKGFGPANPLIIFAIRKTQAGHAKKSRIPHPGLQIEFCRNLHYST
jgi:hypothetical protein